MGHTINWGKGLSWEATDLTGFLSSISDGDPSEGILGTQENQPLSTIHEESRKGNGTAPARSEPSVVKDRALGAILHLSPWAQNPIWLKLST